MPLRTSIYTVPAPAEGERPNRDTGKSYFITEKPALQAARWADRAYLALTHAGIEVPQEYVKAGIIGVLLVGFQAFRNSSYAELGPLLDELMECVQAKPSADVTRPTIDSDIEEITTVYRLRQEVLELHAGFTFAEAASILTTMFSATGSGSSNT